MIEQIPDWLTVIGILILWPTSIYLGYILPGYKKDKENG